MKLHKHEQAAIQALILPFYDSTLNTSIILKKIGATNYPNLEPLLDRVQLVAIQNTIPQEEKQLIEYIKHHKAIITKYKKSEQIKEAPESLAVLALIKCPIRIGYQLDTFLMYEQIAIMDNYTLSPKVIAAIVGY